MFEKELELIKSDSIRVKVHTVLEHISDKFYEVGASSTGKYHPKFAQGPGGLYRHTRAACRIAQMFFEWQDELDKNVDKADYDNVMYERDIVIAALILHDTCKYGQKFEYKYTQHDHPVLASSLILEVLGNNDEEAQDIANCVMSHMGPWTTSKYSQIVLPEPQTSIEIFTHLCDYIASRKYIEIELND